VGRVLRPPRELQLYRASDFNFTFTCANSITWNWSLFDSFMLIYMNWTIYVILLEISNSILMLQFAHAFTSIPLQCVIIIGYHHHLCVYFLLDLECHVAIRPWFFLFESGVQVVVCCVYSHFLLLFDTDLDLSEFYVQTDSVMMFLFSRTSIMATTVQCISNILLLILLSSKFD